MFGRITAGGNRVHVDIKGRAGDELQVRQAGFFGCFAQRGVRWIGFTLAMTAELQPAIQFAVVREQQAARGDMKDESRAGDVAGGAFAAQSERLARAEITDEGDVAAFLAV